MRRISPRKLLLVLATMAAGAFLSAATAEEPKEEPKRSRRPVLAPGQTTPEAPPTPVEVEEFKEEEEPKAPAEPPPPLEFLGEQGIPREDEPATGEESPEGPKEPGEVRYTFKRGNFHFAVTIRPGLPRPGDPVELNWSIQEELLIPDPYLGDRKPLADVPLIANIEGPEPKRTYLVHEDRRPGTFGHHFTPSAEGPYKVTLARRDGKRGIEAQITVPVGRPPLTSTRDLTVDLRPAPAMASDSVAALMRELGSRWMELERKAGTSQAQEAHENLRQFATDLKENAPEKMQPALGGLLDGIQKIPVTSDRNATLQKMDEVNHGSCLRCHAVARLKFAKDVSSWPSFVPNTELTPPARQEQGTRPARRGPVVPGQR